MENANDHPFKVSIVKDADMFANSHPYKVSIEGGGGGGGEARVVDELPEEGESGYIYLVLKEHTEEGDVYDEWIWALQQDGETYGWEHLGATNEVTIEIDSQISSTSENAVQNKVIKQYVDAMWGDTPPTSSTQASAIGKTYINRNTGDMYYCYGIVGNHYDWKRFAVAGQDEPDDYGSLEYYTEVIDEWDISGDNIALGWVDQDVFKNFLVQYNIYVDDAGTVNFEWEESPDDPEIHGWYCHTIDDDLFFSQEEFSMISGIEVTVEDPEWGWAWIFGQHIIGVNTSGPTATRNISSKAEYDALGNGSGGFYNDDDGEIIFPNGETFLKAQIYTYTFPDWWVGYTPDFFLSNCRNLLHIGSDYTVSIQGSEAEVIPALTFGDNFLYGCSSLAGIPAFTENPCAVGAEAITFINVGINFLFHCENLSSLSVHCNNVPSFGKYLPDGFLSGCSSLQETYILYMFNFVEEIGNDCFVNVNFVHLPAFPKVKHIGRSFFLSAKITMASDGNQPLKFPELVSIGDNFLSYCNKLTNFHCSFPSLVHVGNSFLANTAATNYKTLIIPEFPVLTVGDNFLNNAKIGGANFRINAEKNSNNTYSALLMPNLIKAGNSFCQNCEYLPYYLDFSGLVIVGNYFLCGTGQETPSYNGRDLHLPKLQQFGVGFLFDCRAVAGKKVFLDTLKVENRISSNDNNSFSASSNSGILYTRGITLVGSDVTNLMTYYPNRTSSPYRKVFNGGTGETLTTSDIVDNLTSTSTTSALSANQGKVLKGLIDELVVSGAGAPTTATVGTIGQLYEDTTNGKLYQCTAVSGGIYTWVEVGGGSGGGNITFYISYDDVPHSTGVNIRDKNIYADAGLTTPISAMDLRDALDSNNTVNFVLIDLVNGGSPIKCAFKSCDILSAEDLENYSGMTVYIDGAFDGGYYQCYFEGPDPGVFGFALFQ